MAKVKILLDPVGNVMNLWWGNAKDAFSSEEVADPNRNDVVIKDKKGNPIGIEIIGILPKELNVSEVIKNFSSNTNEPYLLHS